MKTLRAKQISMRTLLVIGSAITLFLLLIMSHQARVMTTGTGGWKVFKQSMTNFFYNGLGVEGAQGIGIAIAVIGAILAAISFVVHKLNPQSRMPGWFTCLIVALIGTMLFTGVQPVLKVIQYFRDTILGWFGFSGFGDYTP